MSAPARTTYEVDAEYVSLRTPDGRTTHVRYGDDLPGWVDPETIQQLLKSNAITEFRRL